MSSSSGASPSRTTRGRRCACVAGSAAAVRSPNRRISASACCARDATRQPADDADRIAFERVVRAAERQWRPGVVVDRVAKALRHDTDHGRRCVPQLHDRTEDVVAGRRVSAATRHSRARRRRVRRLFRRSRGGHDRTRAAHAPCRTRRRSAPPPGSAREACCRRRDFAYACGTPPGPRSSAARAATRGSRAGRAARAGSSAYSASRSRTRRSPSGSGIVGAKTFPSTSYQPAPTPIAIASASPPASVRPGYFRSIRSPSL